MQQEAAEKTVGEIDGRAAALPVDVTQTESVSELFRTVFEKHHRVDIVVTTPGANVRKPIAHYQDAEFDRVVELSFL